MHLKIEAVGSSETHNGHRLDSIWIDEEYNYWRSAENCTDIWITFDAQPDTRHKLHQIAKISLQFHPSYKAGKVIAYSRSSRGGRWPTWTNVAEGNAIEQIIIAASLRTALTQKEQWLS